MTKKYPQVVRLFFIVMTIFNFVACGGSDGGNNRSGNADGIKPDYTFSDDTGFYLNSPALSGDRVYIGSSQGESLGLYALTQDLQLIWKYDLEESRVLGSVAVSDDGQHIYAVISGLNDTGIDLLALNKFGELVWRGNFSLENTFHSSPALTVDGQVVAGVGNALVIVDANNGTLLHRYVVDSIQSSPVIDSEKNIYFSYISYNGCGVAASGCANVVSLNGVDYNERWHYVRQSETQTYELTSSAALSLSEDTVYIPLQDEMVALDTLNGLERWRTQPTEMVPLYYDDGGLMYHQTPLFRATPAIDEHGNVYVGSKGNDSSVLYAFAAHDGSILWGNPIGADLYSSPALAEGHQLYVGSERVQGHHSVVLLRAIDMISGETLQHYSPLSTSHGDITLSSAAISDAGMLYIANMRVDYDGTPGMVMAFQINNSGLLGNAGSPRFRVGNQSRGRRD